MKKVLVSLAWVMAILSVPACTCRKEPVAPKKPAAIKTAPVAKKVTPAVKATPAKVAPTKAAPAKAVEAPVKGAKTVAPVKK